MKRTIYLICHAAAILFLSGCMGYQLGGSRPEGIESVHVAPVINKTTESAIELQITEALRQRIQFDGRMKLQNSEGSADGVIDVTLTEYTLTPIAFRDEQRTTAEQYRMRITATATLTNQKTGDVISESKNYGEAIFYFESDLTTSKRDALPQAAHELARFVVDDLIETWQ